MLLRWLWATFARQWRRAAVAILAVASGTALAAALVGTSLDITERMGRELRSYGANILVQPAGAGVELQVGGITIQPSAARGGIDETQLASLKTIFWRNNILGFAPLLSVTAETRGRPVVVTGTWFDREITLPVRARVRTGYERTEQTRQAQTFRTGMRLVAPWWQVDGAWPRDDAPGVALVGAAVAARLGLRPGDSIDLSAGRQAHPVRVVGVVTTGGDEDEQMFVPLPTAQSLAGLDGGADRVLVSALVEPEEKLRADLRGRDPAQMSPEQYATWYCSPVMGAVLTQIREALPGADARAIRRIADAEGSLLSKLGLLMALLTALTLLAAAAAMGTIMTATIHERQREIGLMKALGADDGQITLLFLSEAVVIGLAGGLLGYLAGLGLIAGIAQQVFAAAISPPVLLVPLAFGLALAIALVGSILPVRWATRLPAQSLLRGA